MIRRMVRFAVAAGVAISVAVVVPAQARMLLGERYDGAAATAVGKRAGFDTDIGRGWRPKVAGSPEMAAVDVVRIPVAGLINGERGTLELDLVRGKQTEGDETYFALADKEGAAPFYVMIEWRGDVFLPKIPVLDVRDLWHTEKEVHDRGQYYGKRSLNVPLGKDITVGERFSLAFTWGAKPEECSIFLNGRLLPAIPNKPFRMKEYVDQAVSLVIGGLPTHHLKTASDLSASLIRGVYVYDEPLSGADLYANPEKYRQLTTPVIASLEHDASRIAGFSGKLIAGDALGIALTGTPGATATYDVAHFPDVNGKIELDWKGWGVYLEDKVFYEPTEVNLRDVTGYRVYGSTAPFDPLAPGMEPVAELEVGVQSYVFELPQVDTPFYAAVVADMKDGSVRTVIAPVTGQALTETAPGVYTGSKQIAWGERYERAALVGHLSLGNAVASRIGAAPFAVSTVLNIAVATSPSELRADEKSQSQVTVTVTDANGNPVRGHKMKFVLATTSQYTGTVGGGAFAENVVGGQEFKDQVGGTLSERRWDETDLFGRVTTTYVAGFAAKTAIIVVRDMTSNDTGAGWVKTYIQASAGIELEPLKNPMADEGYAITVTSSDSWLTADGKSVARITARVTLAGKPVEGHKIAFSVTGGGTIRTVKDTTDSNGDARAVYTAGKKIGIVLITATDTTIGLSGSVPIELRSDAPAKIKIKVDPEKLLADGHSTSEVSVLVTDINDNPNDNTEVEYAITEGSGKLRDQSGLTDKQGESRTTYTAGRQPGRVNIEITVRSTVPTEEELLKARGLALAVTDYKFF